jgi:hypothetical protein
LAEIGYAGTAMLAKLSYPEPGAELSMLGAPGDVGDSLPGYDRFGRLAKSPWTKSATVLSDFEFGHDRASRITFKNDLTSVEATTHGQFYGYDNRAGWRPGEIDKSGGFARRARPLGSDRVNLGQVKSADVGQINTGRIARRLIGSVGEAISQGAVQELRMMNVVEVGR